MAGSGAWNGIVESEKPSSSMSKQRTRFKNIITDENFQESIFENVTEKEMGKLR